MTTPLERETIGGIPLGLSRDYDHLPRAGLLRTICCQGCSRLYEDGERLMADGGHVLAIMCAPCREDGRLRWLTEKIVSLPRAVASYRKGDR